MNEGLGPVRGFHLVEARARAETLKRDARDTALGLIAKAEAEAAAITQQAAAEGRASAERDTSREWTSARRRAREVTLAARGRAYAELTRAAAAAVGADPRWLPALTRVADLARRTLGPGADVSIDGGGLRASRKQRHVRWTVELAVAESLARLGPRLEELWR